MVVCSSRNKIFNPGNGRLNVLVEQYEICRLYEYGARVSTEAGES